MPDLVIREHGGALSIEVRVTPRARRNAVMGVHQGALKVALTAPPVEGAANEALVQFLAKALGIAKSRVTIDRGARARRKTVRIEGVSASLLVELAET